MKNRNKKFNDPTGKPETESTDNPIKYYEELTTKQKELIDILFNTDCTTLDPYKFKSDTLEKKKLFIASFFISRIHGSQLSMISILPSEQESIALRYTDVLIGYIVNFINKVFLNEAQTFQELDRGGVCMSDEIAKGAKPLIKAFADERFMKYLRNHIKNIILNYDEDHLVQRAEDSVLLNFYLRIYEHQSRPDLINAPSIIKAISSMSTKHMGASIKKIGSSLKQTDASITQTRELQKSYISITQAIKFQKEEVSDFLSEVKNPNRAFWNKIDIWSKKPEVKKLERYNWERIATKNIFLIPLLMLAAVVINVFAPSLNLLSSEILLGILTLSAVFSGLTTDYTPSQFAINSAKNNFGKYCDRVFNSFVIVPNFERVQCELNEYTVMEPRLVPNLSYFNEDKGKLVPKSDEEVNVAKKEKKKTKGSAAPRDGVETKGPIISIGFYEFDGDQVYKMVRMTSYTSAFIYITEEDYSNHDTQSQMEINSALDDPGRLVFSDTGKIAHNPQQGTKFRLNDGRRIPMPHYKSTKEQATQLLGSDKASTVWRIDGLPLAHDAPMHEEERKLEPRNTTQIRSSSRLNEEDMARVGMSQH